jgi:hypothetical protein
MKSVNAPKQATVNNAIACPQKHPAIRVKDSGDSVGVECGKRPQAVIAPSQRQHRLASILKTLVT